jgi:uncharacterized protein (DUF2344 family)
VKTHSENVIKNQLKSEKVETIKVSNQLSSEKITKINGEEKVAVARNNRLPIADSYLKTSSET